MNWNTISTLITTIVIPVIIPFISVWFAFIITKKHNEKDYLSNQKVQRMKLLTLLRKEAEMFKDYRYHNNTHRSKEFVTIKLVLNSPAFNVDEHGRIIELALEMERINQNIDISVRASTGILSASLGGYLSNLSTGNPIMALSNSRLMKLLTGKKHVEQIGEGLNKMFEKNIQDCTKEALPIIDEIIKEVDKLLLNERGIS
jgi:hypothetical protein